MTGTRKALWLSVMFISLVMLVVVSTSSVVAQSTGDPEEEPVESTIGPQTEEEAAQAGALAKAAQNPIAALVSLPFQYNVNAGVGEFDRRQSVLNPGHAHHHPADERTDR